MEAFNSKPRNFGDLLGKHEEKTVVVPAYQRPFSWEKTHVAAFWSDFWDFHDKRKPAERYFLGPVVIIEGKTEINLLDGQQRVATATIMFSVIRDLARALGSDGGDFARDVQRDVIEKNKKKHYSLDLSETDKPFFRKVIQDDPPSESAVAECKSHDLILKAKNYLKAEFTKKLEGFSAEESLEKLQGAYQTLANALTVVAISVESEDAAYQIFETLNDRGLRLSVPDLMLNFLMRSAGDAGERDSIRDSWSEMLEGLGKRRDPARFIRHYWLSMHGDVKSRKLFTEFKERFSKKEFKGGPVDFADRCAAEAGSYRAILEFDESKLGEAKELVEALISRLGAPAEPLVLAGVRCLSKKQLRSLCETAVGLVVRYSAIADKDSARLETAMFAAARLLSDSNSGKSVEKALNAAQDKLAEIYPSDEEVLARAHNVGLSRNEAHYIVSRIALQMQTKTKEIALGDLTLEHIFPQNPSKNAWPNADELRPLLWNIGNLTVLSKPINSSASNSSIDKKRTEYAKSELLINKGLAADGKWTAKSIVTRSHVLLEWVCKLWPKP
ncbi:DUF262 domain-containing protein [Archangium gephyra]|uniref:DUF262 domain-containing protein n=1 Tax=Archangium gephyra TaxID=48 RepID=UPI003B7F5B9D